MIAANQANARKSTGPKTLEGRNRVRFNGLRHGQAARSFWEAIKALGGNPADLDAILIKNYPLPSSKKEKRLFEQMAYEDWLLWGKCEKRIIFSTDQSRNVL
jgi:hypothetical protein